MDSSDLKVVSHPKLKLEKKSDLEFPYEVVTGVAREFSELYCHYVESPIQFAYMSFLACLGSVLSPHLTLATELKPQPLLYVLLLGPSGSSRKSTIIKLTTEFFLSALMDRYSLNICRGIGSELGLLRQFEGLKDRDQLSILLCLDEFKMLTSKSSITGSAILPCLSTLFDGNRYENYTKENSFNIEEAHLSILAASTPETYDSTWDPQFTDIGLNNRIFIVPGEGKRGDGFPDAIPPDELLEIRTGLNEIIFLTEKSPILQLTPSARALYSDWYKNRENSVHSQRLETYALRLMCLLAVNDRRNEVDENVVENVIKLCDWQLKVRKLYTPVDADNVAAELEGGIRKQLENRGSITRRELIQYTNAYRKGIFWFNCALKNLNDEGEIGFDEKTKRYSIKRSQECSQ